MPYLAATFRHSPRIDLSKPPVPEISAILVSLRDCMSAKIFSHAMRSVCGVLNTHFFTGSMMPTAPASEMNGVPRLFDQRNHRHRRAGGRAADDHVDLVLLDQALGEGARLLGVAGVVIDDQVELAAEHAAGCVDPLDLHLERLLLGVAEERRRPGDGQERADANRLLGGKARQGDEGAGEGGGAQDARRIRGSSCLSPDGGARARRRRLDSAFWYSGTKIRL